MAARRNFEQNVKHVCVGVQKVHSLVPYQRTRVYRSSGRIYLSSSQVTFTNFNLRKKY